MKRVWFFDLDGTLADTENDIRLAWRAAMAELGLVAPDFDRDFVAGPPIEEMAKKLFPAEYTEALGAELRRRFGAHYDHDGFPTTREYPGVREKVVRIRAAGDTVIIATNKRFAGAKLMAEKFGWDTLFDGLYAGDMFKDDPSVGKLRKPELLAYILRTRGFDPRTVTMVGDTVSDFEAAKANGLTSVAVAWGYGKPEELMLADRIARTAEEI